MSPTHVMEGHLLYLQFTDLNVNGILKYAFHIDIQTKLVFDQESVYHDLFDVTLKIHPHRPSILESTPRREPPKPHAKARRKCCGQQAEQSLACPPRHPALVPDTE